MLEKIRTFPTAPSDEELAYALKQLTYARIDNWLTTDFITPGWWLQVFLALLFIYVWWKFTDKKRLLEISFFGLTIMTLSIWLDEAGYEIGLWYYPVDLIPIFPPSTAIDYIMLPVIYSLTYQNCRGWKSFITAIVLISAVFSFICEPLLEKYGFYVLIKWQFYYGFPVYLSMGILLKMLVDKIKSVTQNNSL